MTIDVYCQDNDASQVDVEQKENVFSFVKHTCFMLHDDSVSHRCCFLFLGFNERKSSQVDRVHVYSTCLINMVTFQLTNWWDNKLLLLLLHLIRLQCEQINCTFRWNFKMTNQNCFSLKHWHFNKNIQSKFRHLSKLINANSSHFSTWDRLRLLYVRTWWIQKTLFD